MDWVEMVSGVYARWEKYGKFIVWNPWQPSSQWTLHDSFCSFPHRQLSLHYFLHLAAISIYFFIIFAVASISTRWKWARKLKKEAKLNFLNFKLIFLTKISVKFFIFLNLTLNFWTKTTTTINHFFQIHLTPPTMFLNDFIPHSHTPFTFSHFYYYLTFLKAKRKIRRR